MTLIAAMCFASGVVIASDSKATEASTGDPLSDQSFPTQKLFPIGTAIVWGAAGSGGVTQRVEAAFQKSHKGSPGLYARTVAEVEALCRTVVTGQIQDELKAVPGGNVLLARQMNTPPVGQVFLFAGVNKGATWLTEINWDGQMSSYAGSRGFHAVGSGGLAALTIYNLLHHHSVKDGTVEMARTVLYRIIDICIKSNCGGLGPPTKMWEITAAGAREISDAELTAISDTVGLWEEEERKALTGVL